MGRSSVILRMNFILPCCHPIPSHPIPFHLNWTQLNSLHSTWLALGHGHRPDRKASMWSLSPSFSFLFLITLHALSDYSTASYRLHPPPFYSISILTGLQKMYGLFRSVYALQATVLRNQTAHLPPSFCLSLSCASCPSRLTSRTCCGIWSPPCPWGREARRTRQRIQSPWPAHCRRKRWCAVGARCSAPSLPGTRCALCPAMWWKCVRRCRYIGEVRWIYSQYIRGNRNTSDRLIFDILELRGTDILLYKHLAQLFK